MADRGYYGTKELLEIFESLPDIRLLSQDQQRRHARENDNYKDNDALEAKLKADYIRRNMTFVCSQPISHQDHEEVYEYEFFRNGVKAQVTLLSTLLQKIKDRVNNPDSKENSDATFPHEVKEFLIQCKEQENGNTNWRKRGHDSNVQLQSKIQKRERLRVDREAVCPMLLKLYVKEDANPTDNDFPQGKAPEGYKEFHFHVWKDTTMRDITDLLKEVEPLARQEGSRLHFRLVYADKNGKNVAKEIGIVNTRSVGKEDYKNLEDVQFQVGDFFAVSLMPPPRDFDFDQEENNNANNNNANNNPSNNEQEGTESMNE